MTFVGYLTVCAGVAVSAAGSGGCVRKWCARSHHSRMAMSRMLFIRIVYAQVS